MKTVLYVLLLLAEAALGYWAMDFVWSGSGWLLCLITVAIWAGLMVWRLMRWKKSRGNPVRRRKHMLWIAVIMLLPTAVALGASMLLVISWFVI